MYFRIHFCICIYQRIQFCFLALRFLLKKCIFLLARVLRIAVCPGNSRTKQQPSTKENHHVLPNIPHRHRHHRLLHHPKNPRHLTLNQGESLCSHYHSSSAASPPSTTSSNTSTATNNPPHPNQKEPRYVRNRTRNPRQILLTQQPSYIPPERKSPVPRAHRGFFVVSGGVMRFFAKNDVYLGY